MGKHNCTLSTYVKAGGSFHFLNKCRGFLQSKITGSFLKEEYKRVLTCLPGIYTVDNELRLMHLNHVYDEITGVREAITSVKV